MTKHQSTEETQKNILRVAETLFMELGYQAVSTRQVARECGISQPTLYYHFADKQELYVAVLLDALHRMKVNLEEVAGTNNLSIEEKLGKMAVYLMRQTYHDINLRNMLHDIESQLEEASRLRVSEAFFKSMVLPIVKVLREVHQAENGVSTIKQAFIFLNIISSGADREFHQMNGRTILPEMLVQDASNLTHFFLHGLLHG